MKTILTLLALLCATLVQCAQFTLGWDPVAGAVNYEARLTWGTNLVTLQTTNASVLFTNLPAGVNFTANVNAISVDGVYSGPSTNKVITVPAVPVNLRVSMILESSPMPDGPWNAQTNLVIDMEATEANQFFRGLVQVYRR